jgi:hypothetical protein
VSVRLITLTIVGFILGAFAAGGIGVSVIREVRSVDDATSLPAQNIARADGYHADPNETLISSVALVPESALFGVDGFEISYSLQSLAPMLAAGPGGIQPPLYPKRWLAEAIGGEFEGLLSSPIETAVNFPLMAGGTLDQIETVTVVEAFIPAPFEKAVAVSSTTPKTDVMPGLDLELVSEADNGDTTTIEIRILSDADLVYDIEVSGHGTGWRPASVENDTVTLIRTDDGGGGDIYNLVVFGTSWVPVEGDFTVNIGGFSE